MHTTTEELLEAVFSIQSLSKLNKDEWVLRPTLPLVVEEATFKTHKWSWGKKFGYGP
jgi:hypothetical protein